MKPCIALAIVVGLALPTGANAKPPAAQKPPAELVGALNAMAPASATPPGQTKKKPEHDQGDDNASDNAIDRVCTKDTPAAQRSAICPQSGSPT